MDNPVTLEDVRGSIERPLTPDEERVVPTWLGVAWRELNRVVPGISLRNALPDTDPTYLSADDVGDVIVAMVERKVRHPDGVSQWNGDDYGEKVDPSMASGRIYVTEKERESLMPAAPTYGDGIYSIPLSTR
ncbi:MULTISPECIES: hypothetical protein [unclassified Microbacterium]|uniref:hypothetical protein n=1 Tax=unclassified Microbacterium TaxID=2609290 RepID=UPI000EA942F4|nr:MULTISPECIES: hypothetical protein [unclassified Microbacterium]MBT2485809.1 hypothetical protein [Microbacterium sp. ISL-108]RKN68571.1 hypothetical protein D7252_13920 [Microbacterium sp. CGR2]